MTTVQWLEVYSFTRSEGGKSYIQRKREREERREREAPARSAVWVVFVSTRFAAVVLKWTEC